MSLPKQINLDSWQAGRLEKLLRRGSEAVQKTRIPIVLYRQTMEEEGDSCEEIVCTLAEGYVVEQRITAGGLLRLSIDEQSVYAVDDYPRMLLRKSRERFQKITELLEAELQ